jgi:REP element-mobilizing transposase RayT
MPLCQLYYHIVWTTKGRRPLITRDVEATIHGLVRRKAIGLGAKVYALNGIDEHLHFVGSVPPRIAVATFIGQVKGASSAQFNKGKYTLEPLDWHDGYGVFTFSGKDLQRVIDYVVNQKRHHAENRLIPLLETIGDEPGFGTREPSPIYLTGDTDPGEILIPEIDF